MSVLNRVIGAIACDDRYYRGTAVLNNRIMKR